MLELLEVFIYTPNQSAEPPTAMYNYIECVILEKRPSIFIVFFFFPLCHNHYFIISLFIICWSEW